MFLTQASGPRELILDGANGVGALKVPMLTEALGDLLKIDLRNTGQAKGDVLNFECGADFVFVPPPPPLPPPRRHYHHHHHHHHHQQQQQQLQRQQCLCLPAACFDG